jgi:hypothetical protein
MDEAQALEAVANILGEISSKPLDLSLHLQHIELAKALDDLESQLTAFQMVSEFLAVGDEVWLPFLAATAKSVNLETKEGAEDLLQLYEKAEGDYLCKSRRCTLKFWFPICQPFSYSNPPEAPELCC